MHTINAGLLPLADFANQGEQIGCPDLSGKEHDHILRVGSCGNDGTEKNRDRKRSLNTNSCVECLWLWPPSYLICPFRWVPPPHLEKYSNRFHLEFRLFVNGLHLEGSLVVNSDSAILACSLF